MECCNRTVQVGHRCSGCPHEETSNHMVAAPASYRGEIDPPTVTAEFIALVVNERDALRKRVTDLLEANNRLVERNRVLQEFQVAFERSEDELATVRTKLDMLTSSLRELAA